MPPSTLSTRPFYMHAPVALAGFSPGQHLLPSLSVIATALGNSTLLHPELALHAHFTSIVSSMPIPANNAYGTTWASGEHGPHMEGADGAPNREYVGPDVGFVSYKPEQGLSGGAVLDTGCHLVGIIERRSFWAPSGRFVRLSAQVLKLLQDAVCGAMGAGAGACKGG